MGKMSQDSLINRLYTVNSYEETKQNPIKGRFASHLFWFKQNPRSYFSKVFEKVTGYNPYRNSLAKTQDSGSIEFDVLGHNLIIPFEDGGLPDQLIRYNIREYQAYKAYQSELQSLEKQVESINVIEVGANLGYYLAILEDGVSEEPNIIAFEPDPRNFNLLQENIERIGLENVESFQYAIGDREDTVSLEISDKVNTHRVIDDEQNTESEVIEVQQKSIDKLLPDLDIDPNSINVVRMDLEGYEINVMRGMESVLCGDGPMILHIEIHKKILSDDELSEIISLMKDNGFELVVAGSCQKYKLDVDSLDDLINAGFGSFQVVARR